MSERIESKLLSDFFVLRKINFTIRNNAKISLIYTSGNATIHVILYTCYELLNKADMQALRKGCSQANKF